MKVINFVKNLIKSKSEESSKRASALYTVVVLVTPITWMHTNPDNLVLVLVTLTGFVATLFGIAVHQDIRNNRIKNEQE